MSELRWPPAVEEVLDMMPLVRVMSNAKTLFPGEGRGRARDMSRRVVLYESVAWLKHYKVAKVSDTDCRKYCRVKLTKAMAVEVVVYAEFISVDIAIINVEFPPIWVMVHSSFQKLSIQH